MFKATFEYDDSYEPRFITSNSYKWNYEEEIEKLKKTPLYADGRYDAAVADFKAELDAGKKPIDIDTIKIAHRHFDPEYDTLSFMKKGELLTNIEHMRVDTIAH